MRDYTSNNNITTSGSGNHVSFYQEVNIESAGALMAILAFLGNVLMALAMICLLILLSPILLLIGVIKLMQWSAKLEGGK